METPTKPQKSGRLRGMAGNHQGRLTKTTNPCWSFPSYSLNRFGPDLWSYPAPKLKVAMSHGLKALKAAYFANVGGVLLDVFDRKKKGALKLRNASRGLSPSLCF